MGSLANETISSTYDGLIKTNDEQPLPASGVRLLQDGSGNNSALSIGQANQGATVTGTLTATAFSGDLTGDVTGDLTGSVLTAAQTNITSLGTLSSLTVSGALNGTLSTASQPNITSVGTLSSLAVSGNLTVDTDTLYVDATSNEVGVGTSSPARTFHAKSSTGVHRFDSVGTANLLEFITTNNTTDLGVYVGCPVSTTNTLAFATASTERMRIDSSGNVGIGTTSPSALLQITGPNAVGNFFIANNDGAAGAIFKRENASSFPYNTYSFLNGYVGINTSSPQTALHVAGGIRFSSSGADANRWSVYWNGSSGDLIVVNNISDIRAKKDLDYNIKGLETVQKLKPVKFTWKDGTSHSTSVSGRLRQYGFIAQETMEADDYLAWHNEEQDTWGIEQYESFSAVMVKAIQEQQEIINDLKSRIETLENK